MKFAASFLVAMGVSVGSLCGATVYGTAAPLGSGSRTEGNPGLVGTGRFADFTVSWQINDIAGPLFEYIYTFDFGSIQTQNSISHLILDLSDSCVDGQGTLSTACVSDSSIQIDEAGNYGPHPSNPGFPAGNSIVGVKFGAIEDVLTLSFSSERAPMWGNVYGKAGSSDYFYNTGLPNTLTSENTLDFIAVPDTTTTRTQTPEPGSALLILGGAAAVFVVRRKRGQSESKLAA